MSSVHRPPPLGLAALPASSLLSLTAIAWCASVLWPLATYSLTLVLFGPAHVASELAYLHRRFSGWLGQRKYLFVALLLGIAGLRLAALLECLPRSLTQQAELLAGLGLVAAAAPLWLRGSWASTCAGFVAAGILAVGLLWYPVHVLLLVAVSHNWTPVAIIGEAIDPKQRVNLGIIAIGLFVGLPVLIATGLPWSLADAAGLGASDASVLATGTLQSNYGAYLPSELRDTASAQQLFSAITFAQCLHYISVIGVLPKLGPARVYGSTLVWWIVAGTALLAMLYLHDFRLGRSTYGVIASVHAWIELPILLFALLPREGTAVR